MRNLHELNEHRVDSTKTHGWSGDGSCGSFEFPSPIDGQPLRVIASSDFGWDHISVSRSARCPNWPEMEFIRRKFFNENECVMQLHVPITEHINMHPRCLHLWRPQHEPIPRPPAWMITEAAERYWEARWRDEKAENERLRALLQELLDIEGPQPGTAGWAAKVRAELEQPLRR